MSFKIPDHIPQDLLLIHGFIGESTLPKFQKLALASPNVDCIDSSDSDNASEDEIEADLMVTTGDNELIVPKPTELLDSDSESESDSRSDESNDDERPSVKLDVQDHDVDDDEEVGPVLTTGTYFQTKHEVLESDIIIPDLEEVGPEEVLEKVGEIMGIIDKLVIIKGVPSEVVNRGSERALDSDTLLVFEDRKVMGHIYETFGPTSQPLYQVKFSHTYPLDPEQVRICREVFHVPRRSRFVFVNQIKRLKGSDASNVHDEEPADDELEFSDDEAEAAFKSNLKRKRGDSRANSVASSRHPTPTPSQMRDQDLVDDAFLCTNAYDEHGPYDMDFSAAPSRPAPIPYDDPYSDEYNGSTSSIEPITPSPGPASGSRRAADQTQDRSSGRGGEWATGRGRGGTGQKRDVRGGRELGGRGRGRGRGPGDHGVRGKDNRGRSDRGRVPPRSINEGDTGVGWLTTMQETIEPYNPHFSRPLSPTSLAIARATGQLADGSNFTPQASPISDTEGAWAFHQSLQQPQQLFNFGPLGYQQSYVQPHINPRFASQFGINLDFEQPQPYSHHERYGQGFGAVPERHPVSNGSDEWIVHGTESKGGSGSSEQNNAPQ